MKPIPYVSIAAQVLWQDNVLRIGLFADPESWLRKFLLGSGPQQRQPDGGSRQLFGQPGIVPGALPCCLSLQVFTALAHNIALKEELYFLPESGLNHPK
jgi:hypothetical protein